MRQKIINFLKTNDLFYDIYYYLGSFAVRLLGIFLPIKSNRILFVSFGGKKYDDSPKAIYEKMINDDNFSDFDFYWAFVDKDSFDILKGKKIQIDTLEYFLIALTSKIWITNSAVERGLSFKKKNTFYINTWHGTPIKKIGKDMNSKKDKRSGLGNKGGSTEDLILAQSDYDANIFSYIFDIDIQKIKKYDLPRNDILSNKVIHKSIKENVRKEFNIPTDKKIILYAPTYREFDRDKNNNCYIKPPIDITLLSENLGEKFIILFRAHYEVIGINTKIDNSFMIDVSDYNNLNNLMIASDMLISDYSSIFFDYSILEKPMFCFAYDYEEYLKERGLYLDIKKELPCRINQTQEELIEDILSLDYKLSVDDVRKFKNKYCPFSGSSTDKVIELLKEKVSI